MSGADLAERIELFTGGSSEALCRVYARLDVPDAAPNWQLGGTLTGPSCAYGETLAATFRFVDRGPGETLLAEAIVPEPNLWTAEMPHLYQAVVEIREGSHVVSRAERIFGVRALGAAGRKLRWAGKNWVLRGVRARSVRESDLADWHAADTALVVRNPEEVLCEAASRVGVLVVAELDDRELDALKRLGRWPAVGFVLISSTAEVPAGARRNLLVGRRFTARDAHVPLVDTDVVFCEVDDAQAAIARLADCPRPVIAMRLAGGDDTIAAGRTRCDLLQRELAPRGQFAGYIA